MSRDAGRTARPRDLVSCFRVVPVFLALLVPLGIGLALHGASGPAANHEPDSNRRPAQQQIDIVLNWFEELKTKVPTK